MHDLAFADAVRPLPVRILRLTLRPYTLGSESLLLAQRNPLLFAEDFFNALDQTEQRQAVIRAVLICENTWEENAAVYEPVTLSILVGQSCRFALTWLWGRTIRHENFPLAIAEFRNYLHESRASFPGPDPEADRVCAEGGGYEPMSKMRGRTYGAPHLARLLEFVTENARFAAFGYQNPYDFPYALANNLYATARETDGSMRIENFDELEEKNHIAKLMREIAESRAAEKAANIQQPTTNIQHPVAESGLATPPPPDLL